MKRIIFLVLVILLVTTFNVVAGNFEFVGGTSLNKLELNVEGTEKGEDEEYTIGLTVENQTGNEFYGGVRYILDNGLGFGAGYESLSVTTVGELYFEESFSDGYWKNKYK